MKQKLKDALGLPGAAYVDAMYESTESMSFSYFGREIQSVSTTRLEGGRTSVIDRGGYAAASFTRPEELEAAVREAETAAREVARIHPTNRIVPREPVKDVVRATPRMDPREISFEEKRRLLEHYLGIALDQPRIYSALGSYAETVTRRTFVSTEGSEIEQEILLCRMGIRMIAKDGSVQESIGLPMGYDQEYARLIGREGEVERRARIAADLLDARPVEPGVYVAVCDNDLTGTFTHEAFGHLSESDDTWNNPPLQDILKIGRPMGRPILNIVDDGTVSGAPGTFAYDEEGTPASRTYLIREGVLSGRLYSRLTAAALDGEPTGNFRAADYRFMPLVRMSNIFIEAGKSTVQDIMSSVEDGLYLCGGKGGQTMGDLFTFGAQYGYLIQRGRKVRMVKDINISGNVFDTLASISMVGDDLKFVEAGGCGKTRMGLFDMQMLDKSGTGGPHVRVDRVVVGG